MPGKKAPARASGTSEQSQVKLDEMAIIVNRLEAKLSEAHQRADELHHKAKELHMAVDGLKRKARTRPASVLSNRTAKRSRSK